MKNWIKVGIICLLVLMLLLICACDDNASSELNEIFAPDSSQGITSVPSSFSSSYIKNFDRYACVIAANGEPIHILAQTNISNEQIIRCRGVLEHYLRDFHGSEYGYDKAGVANKMAENNATLLLLNGSDDGSNPLELDGQPLFENEIQVEGTSWYMSQDYEQHRDATFEEILHLIHDYGIGVDGEHTSPGALPDYQREIRSGQVNALENNIWGIDEDEWIAELSAENSLSQEYLASIIDSYYGLWGAWTENSHGMWGIYIAKTRDDISSQDPTGLEIVEKYFHPYLTYNARIDSSFDGIFSLKFNNSLPYTNHSRNLKDITLLGSNDVKIIINELDNDITGNFGVNTIEFTGSLSEYAISSSSLITTVSDNNFGRDGNNILRNIEILQFEDQSIEF